MKKAHLSALVALAFSAIPFAVSAQSTPAPGSGSLDVWFKAPTAGATVKGILNLGSSCYVNGTGVSRVQFFLDTTALNTDSTMADGMQCALDTTKFANGTHQLKAVAYSSTGASRSDVISINIQNSATTPPPPPPPANTAPTVSLTSPTASQTVAGTLAYAANAADDAGVARVDFSVDGNSVLSKTAAPYSGTLDTTKLANGTHTLRAVAFDAAGLSAASQVSFNVQNAVIAPPVTPPTTGASTPAPGSGSLDVWFKSPAAGATIKGILNLGSSCYVNGTGVSRVQFFLDSTALNTDTTMADGMQCALDTTRFANGTHQLKAVAYDSSGATRADVISINIQNGSTTPTPTPIPNVAPTVSLTAPAAGATISGSAAACAASASDDKAVAKVEFYLGTTLLSTATSSPYACTIDTTKVANGTYTLMARATDAEGASSTAQRSVTVSNVVAPPPPAPSATSAISGTDILGEAQAGVPFAVQSGFTGAVMGSYPDVKQIPESGITGPTLPNGETLRLGKVTDPLGSGKMALAFQLGPNDPTTSSSKRSEFEFPPFVKLDTVYWVAYSAYVYDWGTLPSGDESLFGTQVHSGDTSRGLSPSFTIASFDGRSMRVSVQYSTDSSPTPSNTTSIKYPDWSSPGIPIPFGRWVDFVFKMKESQSAGGILQAWMDGQQIVNYQGPLGFNTPGYLNYFKFGYYNWSAFNSSRKVLLRSPVIVQDPTGNKYQATDLRSYVQAR